MPAQKHFLARTILLTVCGSQVVTLIYCKRLKCSTFFKKNLVPFLQLSRTGGQSFYGFLQLRASHLNTEDVHVAPVEEMVVVVDGVDGGLALLFVPEDLKSKFGFSH